MIIEKDIIKKAPNTKYVGFYPEGENTKLVFFNDRTSTQIAILNIEGQISDKKLTFVGRLFDVMKKNIGKEIEIDFKAILTVKIEKSRFTFNPMEEMEINVDYPKEESNIQIKKSIIENAMLFAGQNSKRPILNGINVSNESITATDSFKCYLYGTYKEGITIPLEFAKELVKSSDDEVEIKFDKRMAYADINGVIWITRLLEGTYPNIEKVINLNSGDTFNLGNNCELVKEMLKQSLMANEDNLTLINYENNLLNIVIKDKFQSDEELSIGLENMRITFPKGIIELIVKFMNAESDLTYLGSAKPLYIKNNDEILVLLPIKEA